MVRVGTIGWSHPDWKDLLPGPKPPRKLGYLERLAELVDLVEIDTLFTGGTSQGSVPDLLYSIAENPEFRFSVKLHPVFSHFRRFSATDMRVFTRFTEQLLAAGRLAAVLLRFPLSFRYSSDSRAYIKKLKDIFAHLPLVVDTPNRTFNRPEFTRFLADLGVGCVLTDRRVAPSASNPREEPLSLSPVYFSFSGRAFRERSSDSWDDLVNDYLYSVQELSLLADGVKRASISHTETLVVFNNVAGGRALLNALQMKALISGGPVQAPAELLRFFPGTEGLLMRRWSGQQDLFEDDGTFGITRIGPDPFPALHHRRKQRNGRPQRPPAGQVRREEKVHP